MLGHSNTEYDYDTFLKCVSYPRRFYKAEIEKKSGNWIQQLLTWIGLTAEDPYQRFGLYCYSEFDFFEVNKYKY